MWARFPRDAAVHIVACPVTQHNGAARVERCVDEFAGLTGALHLSRFGIDYLKHAEIGEQVIAARFAWWRRTFTPRHARFGEPVGAPHAHLARAPPLKQ